MNTEIKQKVTEGAKKPEGGGQRSEFWSEGDRLKVISAHVVEGLKQIPDGSVQCVPTSPPYWGLRSYLPKGHPLKHLEIGQEPTPAAYVETMVAVFREIWRVLRDDGTVWLNLGDSYAGSGKAFGDTKTDNKGNGSSRGVRIGSVHGESGHTSGVKPPPGFKAKDLIGIPWRVAFALQADGWFLRSDIVWAKPNCMPESVTDRPTRSHEYIFLLTKKARYFYDAEAIKEPAIYDVDGTGTAARKARSGDDHKAFPADGRNGIRPAGYKNSVNFNGKNSGNEKQRGHSRRHDGFSDRWDAMEKEEQFSGMRNKRDVWTVSTACYPEAHFATFPPELIKPCILAGTSAGGACAECGAPLRREIEVGSSNIEHQRACGGDANGEYEGQSTKDHAAHGVQDASAVKARILAGLRERKTTGWGRTCKCDNGAPQQQRPTLPCVVLDPFGGSGTTGEVALELGRRAILIELNPDYLPLIEKRTNITPGLMV